MPELRVDPLTGMSVILAPGRASRPDTHREHTGATGSPAAPATGASCPFGPGNEHMTPPEVFRTGEGAPGTPGWRARVVPNLYPIVGPPLAGAHEVVILSPDHDAPLASLSDAQAIEVFSVLRDRAAHHLAAGLVHAQPFFNYGRAAGASIEHPHAQLVALATVPPAVARSVQLFADAPVDLVTAAIHENSATTIWKNDEAVAWCAPASLSPYEVLIAHASSGPRFDRAGNAELAAVAVTIKRVLCAIGAVLGDVPYNVVVHTAPATAERFHWYARVTPRVTVTAGFEFATDILVNTIAPEIAAPVLRDAMPAA